jgi:hypothetical protein
MGEKHMPFDGHLGQQLLAQDAQSGTPIENEQRVAKPHLDARRVSTIFNGFGTGTGNAPANAPKTNLKLALRA